MPPAPAQLPLDLIARILRESNHATRVRAAATSRGMRGLLASGIRTNNRPRAHDGGYSRVAGSSTPRMTTNDLHASTPSFADTNRLADALLTFHAELSKIARGYAEASRSLNLKPFKARFRLAERLFQESGMAVTRTKFGFGSNRQTLGLDNSNANSNYNSNTEHETCELKVKMRLMPGCFIEVTLAPETKRIAFLGFQFKAPRGTRLWFDCGMDIALENLKKASRPREFWENDMRLFVRSNARQGPEGIRAIMQDIQLLHLALALAYRFPISLQIGTGTLQIGTMALLKRLFAPLPLVKIL